MAKRVGKLSWLPRFSGLASDSCHSSHAVLARSSGVAVAKPWGSKSSSFVFLESEAGTWWLCPRGRLQWLIMTGGGPKSILDAVGGFLSLRCHDKFPPSQWLRAEHVYHCSVPEASRPAEALMD